MSDKEIFGTSTDSRLRRVWIGEEGEITSAMRAFLRSRCPELADELFQDAMISIWQYRRTYKPQGPTSLRAWAITICQNTLRARLRRDGKRVDRAWGGSSNLVRLDEATQLPDDIRLDDDLRAFANAVKEVRRWYRRPRQGDDSASIQARKRKWLAFRLRWRSLFKAAEGFSPDDIARKLRLSAPEVSRAIYQVIQRITKQLEATS